MKDELKGNYKVVGTLMCVLSDFLFGFMILYLKSILKKFSFYLNFGEFSGYFGLFSSPFIFIILILQACIPKDLLKMHFSYQFLIFCFLSALSDYFLFKYLKFCTKTTFSNNFAIEASILLIFFKLSSNSVADVFKNAYFYFEIVFFVLGILISIGTYNEAENRKIKSKMITKQNYIERTSNYFSPD